MLSVAAVQLRLIWAPLPATALSPVGADGGIVSGAVGTIDAFMSAWTSVCDSARLYTRTSSIRPVKYSP